MPSAEVPKYIEEVKNNMKAKETTDDGALQFFIPIKDKETEIKVFNLLDKELMKNSVLNFQLPPSLFLQKGKFIHKKVRFI